MSLIVHHLNNSRSQRILWLLEEIGADYEIRYYDHDPVTNLAPPELLAVHPLGKSPLIEESGVSASGGRGRVIIASGAITESLCDRLGGGHLGPESGRADPISHLAWPHFAEAAVMNQIMLRNNP